MLLQGCVPGPQPDVTDRIFRGEALFGKLPPAIRQSPLADACPPPAISRIHYVYRGFPDEATSGSASYLVADRTRGIAGLAVAASGHAPDEQFEKRAWPTSSGRVLSCGGLFTLALREQRAHEGMLHAQGFTDVGKSAAPEIYNAKQPNRRYAVAQITGYSGRLLPLRVGNELSFSYAALLQSPGNRRGHADGRSLEHVQFRVLDVKDSFMVNGLKIPGRVFLVEQVRDRKSAGVVEQRDFYYSETLGWVVKQVRYDNGSPVSIMDVTGWY